ncbi:hypothetical protein PENANT_c035G05473 [Penicillium antarcticum]|uniref:Altered inheritance of mitochondria protein 6 n=1 Tax=Penicillium antarcticum TaxID=416450 RepID=A0A1V6PU07_9EURO|nr:hypothetical protein PENANT_c035G05473 [Penicillium antarcticum]
MSSGILNLFALSTKTLRSHFQDLELIIYPPKQSPYSAWSTHGVTPIRCHSHNDYWRHVPLHSALSAGCISVEADVWPWRDQILVGHSRYTVLAGSLDNLYLGPLGEMLDLHNQKPGRGIGFEDEIVGVFANNLSQTLVLLIDFKSDGDALWSLLSEALAPLREKGYLTHFNGTAGYTVMRPVTVVVSGDVSFANVVSNQTYRDIFFDAPLDNLTQLPVDGTADQTTITHQDQHKPRKPHEQLTNSPFNPYNSYYASADFSKAIGPLQLGRLSESQLQTLRSQIHAAHELGLKVRYWGNPGWPIGLRNHVWDVLVHEGVDVISTDDLKGATREVWRDSSWWWW